MSHCGCSHADAARPGLAEALDLAADPSRVGLRSILVQPRILFRGHVEEQVTAAVNEARRRHAGFEWVQVPRLGADRPVAQALVERVCEVCPNRETAVLPG